VNKLIKQTVRLAFLKLSAFRLTIAEAQVLALTQSIIISMKSNPGFQHRCCKKKK
jgi:hypothetical protein